MPLTIYLGTYGYLVDTCPRKVRVRMLFTAAPNQEAAQAIFRRFITKQDDYYRLMGIQDELVLEPLRPTDRLRTDEARMFASQLVRFHFEFVDPETDSLSQQVMSTLPIPDRVAVLVARKS